LDLRRGDGPVGARHYNFAALTTTEALITKEPEVAAAAVRAIMAAQAALKNDPSLARKVGNEVFPGGDEVEIMPTLIARDAPFYDPTITPEAVKGLNDFAMANKLISQPLAFEDIVATQYKELWSKAARSS
jgi:NitT/TauT family transport system substrate-binding protein